ncbi:hypothetical protein [Sphingomonas mollis]|uniref:Uncharacterized protein n=1 Tax=Sphingomonas mollis TaxID=2795726 RepID=A0ABS0XUA7_9SPHN|nr:hypothetical protein [Sphingomonas sp. BT553]MBJ6123333.1 hypothetical protein [Sphingomonas sp. BT553]
MLTTGNGTNLVGAPSGGPPLGQKALANVSALAADPLDQQVVNGVIAAKIRATGNLNGAASNIMLLRQLGWRSTTALQNLLWLAGTTGDLSLVMDTMDALLRREKLLGQIYPVLNLMTTDPAFRNLLIQRLATRPPWRRYYFMSASDLSKPDQIEGRYLVMRAIQRRGDRLTRNEVAPILAKLTGVGRTAQAFDLWRAQAGTVATPLADTNFAIASLPIATDALPVPFEWQLASGSGYFADANHDDRGSFVSIDWNGRGAPLFVSQLTSGRAGRYQLDVTGDTPMSMIADRIGFRLACPGGKMTQLDPANPRATGHMQLVSVGRVTCDFPKLELYGLTQTGSSSASVVLRTIRLDRIG